MFAFVPITIIAAGFQVARNALQRSLLGGAGPWGATLVRFLFGLPFSLTFAVTAQWLSPHAYPHWTAAFWRGACGKSGPGNPWLDCCCRPACRAHWSITPRCSAARYR